MSCRIQKQRRTRSAARGDDLGRRLYEWREDKDLSQSEAALKLKVSTRTLQEWEQGRARPRGLALAAINERLRV